MGDRRPNAEQEAAAAVAASDSPTELTKITMMARDLIGIASDIEYQEEQLSKLKREKYDIVARALPELMAEAGMGSGDDLTVDGWKFLLTEYVSGSWPKDPDQRARAKSLLEEYDALELIKTNVSVAFGRGEEKRAAKAAKAMSKFGDPVIDENVHHSSLAAFARERLSKGEEIDFDRLGLRSEMLVRVKKQSVTKKKGQPI